MNLRTELHPEPSSINIRHDSPILMMGSCFSQNIGLKMQKYKFKCIVNPFGTIFNPVSIARIISRCVECRLETEEALLFSQGLWVHPDYHSQLGSPDKLKVVENINQLIIRTHEDLKKCQVIFLTLGSSVGYEYKKTGRIVANCHKMPTMYFDKRPINIKEIMSNMDDALALLTSLNPNLHVVMTVSPVRHVKEGIVANSFSKARLHVAIEHLMDTYKHISYFPAYEWMLDDLRDYRFYDQDLIHPSDLAVDIIWQKFYQVYFDNHTREMIHDLEKIFRDQNHRPLNTETEEYQKFKASLAGKIEIFLKKYPHVSWD